MVGIFLFYIVNYIFVDVEVWCWMFGLVVVLLLFLFIGILFMFESLCWLFMNGEENKVKKVFEKLCGIKDID